MNSSEPVSRPAARRRGRPRSAVFTYYRRLVDSAGRFLGNECQFCTFISRDRSENPTYLTRHLLRTCAAPEEVKNTVTVRHPHLALNNLPPSTRINPPKDVTNLQHTLTQPPTQTTTNSQLPSTSLPHTNDNPRFAPLPVGNTHNHTNIQKSLKHIMPSTIHHQTESCKHHQTSTASEAAAAAAAAIAAVAEAEADEATSMGMDVSDPNTEQPRNIQSNENTHEQTRDTHQVQQNAHQSHDSRLNLQTEDSNHDPVSTVNDPEANRDVDAHEHHENTDSQIDNDGDTTMIPNPQTTQQTHSSHTDTRQNNHNAMEITITQQNQPHNQPSTVPSSVTPHSSHLPSDEMIDSVHHADTAPSIPSPVLMSTLRQHGVTKSRRGRPRSPALAHFRRHVDTEGTFIANQCLHCDFVSRDKSENSTLLLRHLLSQACQLPPDVLRVLQASRSTNRRGRGRKSRANSFSYGVARGDSGAEKPVTLALLRFCLAHGLNLQVVQSPYFTNVIKAAQEYDRAISNDLGKGSDPKLSHTPDSIPTIRYDELNSMLKNIAVDDLLTEKASVDARYSTTSQLIIHFPRLKKHRNVPTFVTSLNESVSLNRDSQGSFIASVFRLTSGRDLAYLFSKNCESNFTEGIQSILNESTRNGYIKFDQILVNRPMCQFRKGHRLPSSDKIDYVWVTDVAREVDWFCQQPLAEVPLLVRCVTQSKLLATFFREDCNRDAAMVFFGKDLLEKELCQRYLAHVSNVPDFLQCSQVLQTASLTYEILRQVQTTHSDSERNAESSNYVHGIERSSSGNAAMTGETLRLLLSTEFRKDLKAFIAVMTPLSKLISRYSLSDGSHSDRRFVLPSAGPGTDATFYSPIQFRSRSIVNVLPDCVRALTDLYDISLTEHRQDLSMFIEHVACCLLGKGAGGFPPVASGICYVAAFLTPWDNMEGVKDNTVNEAWERALKFIEATYPNSENIPIIIAQLEDFRKRTGLFSNPDFFNDAHESDDPRSWWDKHLSRAPELHNLAMKVLNAPTTTFPVIREISERNALDDDLRGPERDSLMEKKRIGEWNLKLAMCKPEDDEHEDTVKELAVGDT